MPDIPFVINVVEQCSEKEFIKAVVQEARLQARKFWRSKNSYTPSKGGRPSLEKRVEDACDIVWKEWGGKFPKHNSTAGALVQKVAALLDQQTRKGKDGKERPKRKDLRTIEKFARRWIASHLNVEEVPDSWLRRPDGRAAVKALAIMALGGLMLKHKDDPSKIEEIRQAFGYPTDKQLADRLIRNRRKNILS